MAYALDDSMRAMADVLEYTYSDKADHLTESDALEQYSRARSEHPDALVMLRDLDCGHWQVQVHETEQEKQQALRERWASIFRMFTAAFKVPPKR